MPRGREYRFMTTPAGQNPTNREFQRTVRSHAASVSHPDRITRRRARIREQNSGEGIIVFDSNSGDPAENRHPRSLPAVSQADELTVTSRRGRSDYGHHQLNPNIPSTPYRLHTDYLTGDIFSPIVHLTTYHQPYLPGIVNHYISNLTIPIPELDGDSVVPLFRAAWLPIVFHDPLVFQVVVLFAATHYATFADPSQFNGLYMELLSLKQSALLALIQRVQDEQTIPSSSHAQSRYTRDTMIAAAAKMASYEAIFGTGEAVSLARSYCYGHPVNTSEQFHLHMSTVTRLLRQQGGLTTLGMDGFLARLLSFIDTNSAFLLGTNLYFVEFGLPIGMPHHQSFGAMRSDDTTSQVTSGIRNTNVVNLERFIGFINTRADDNEDS